MTGYQRARGVVPAAPYRVAVVRWLDTTSPLGWQSCDKKIGSQNQKSVKKHGSRNTR